MSTKVSKTAIGAFVLGAIVLLVAGVLVFGGGQLFVTKHTYITYFDGSVKGLNVGSPVMFRGVKVGSVDNISIVADPAKRQLRIPVVFTLEPAKVQGTKAEFRRDPNAIEKAVKEFGLRTQLQSLSFLTGQLMVALDFFPDKPAVYVGLNKEYPEIPSVPMPLEQLQKTFEELPLKELVKNLNETIIGIDQLVKSVNARKTMQGIEAVIRDVQTLIRHVDEQVTPLVEGLNRTTGAAETALNETGETMAAARGGINELVEAGKSTLESARATLEQSQQTLRTYSGDSQLVYEINKTLRDLSATVRSFKNLSDYLERHPESLLRGKPAPKGE